MSLSCSSPSLGGLVSYAGGETGTRRFLERARELGVPSIVDSGAWSVFRGVASVSLEEHTEAVRGLLSDYPETRFVGLDVIGNPEETYTNWRTQREAGVPVEPTIHYGAAPVTVKRYVDWLDPGEWLNLGGMAHLQRPSERRRMAGWIAAVMREAPEQRFHALGAVTPYLLDRLPLDSADSTYWKLPVVVGRRLSLYDEEERGWKGVICRRDSEETYRSAGKHAKLLRSYGVSLAEWPEVSQDNEALLRLSLAAHLRLISATERRHGKAFTVYLAGVSALDLKFWEGPNGLFESSR